MLFKNPAVLYALSLLIIPILIHLFQLRRFQKVEFTNVKLLKKVKLQTRKSSRLKKWLVLLSRLIALACAVIAFAQPYIPNSSSYNEKQETVIYFDNSFSMQANGKNGTLLNEAIQSIISSFPEDQNVSIITNDDTYKNNTLKAIKNDLIGLRFSTNQLNYKAAYLKGTELFSNDVSSKKNFVMVSDFQQKAEALDIPNDSLFEVTLVQQIPNTSINVSIDSAYIKNKTAETIDLAVKLSSYGDGNESVTVSLYNKDMLLAKNATDFDTKNTELLFSIPNNSNIEGRIEIDDSSLDFDNIFYFNLNERAKIKVLAINGEKANNFLQRIYTEDEFEFQAYDWKVLDYSLIPNQNFIVFNELETVSTALQSALMSFVDDGGGIAIVPAEQSDIESYNKLLSALNLDLYSEQILAEKRITRINFDHPLLTDTFYSRVSNFQYPIAQNSILLDSRRNSVLSFEDNSSFISGRDKSYVFASALNSNNSNFIKTQLVVPIFYNMALQSLELPKLFYFLGVENTIAIQTKIGQDEILTLASDENSIIPLQNTFSNSVVLKTNEFPDKAGIVSVKNKTEELEKLSFNYSREESALNYFDLTNLNHIKLENSLSNTIETIKSNANVNALWKWFVIFALLFLLIEMLLLKFLK